MKTNNFSRPVLEELYFESRVAVAGLFNEIMDHADDLTESISEFRTDMATLDEAREKLGLASK